MCEHGQMQAAFTTKELREATKLPGVALHIPPDALQLTDADRAEMAASRVKKRLFDILTTAAAKPAAPAGCVHALPALPGVARCPSHVLFA